VIPAFGSSTRKGTIADLSVPYPAPNLLVRSSTSFNQDNGWAIIGYVRSTSSCYRICGGTCTYISCNSAIILLAKCPDPVVGQKRVHISSLLGGCLTSAVIPGSAICGRGKSVGEQGGTSAFGSTMSRGTISDTSPLLMLASQAEEQLLLSSSPKISKHRPCNPLGGPSCLTHTLHSGFRHNVRVTFKQNNL
jgi:hypothetical protein